MKNKRLLDYKTTVILLFGILYFNESIYFRETVSATTSVLLTVGLFAMIVIYKGIANSTLLHINKRLAVVATLLCSLVIASCLVNGFNAIFDGYTIIVLVLAAFMVSSLDYDVFKKAYVDVMSFLAIASIVIFLLYNIIPGAFSIFPNYLWRGNSELLKNCILCVVQVSAQHRRNFGIFYEPGMFAVFLGIALFFALFAREQEIKKVIVLLLALLSTLSTMGLICATILVSASIVDNKNISAKFKRRIFLVAALVIGAAILFFISNNSAWEFLIGKFSEVQFSSSVDMTVTGSGYERWRSVVCAWNAFIMNPVFGIGFNGWNKYYSKVITTATPLNWFGYYGFAFGCVMNYLYIKASVISKTRTFSELLANVLLVFFFLLQIMSQNMARDIIICMLIFFMARNDRKVQI